MYIVLQNTVSMVFGDDTKTLRLGIVREGLLVFGARITPVQIAIIVTSLVLVTGLWLFLRYSKMGRAVASDPKLAAVCGIDADRVIIWAFAIGSALAGVAGILVALDVDMTPTMGMQPMLMGIVAVIVGGNTFSGAIWGSLFVGMSRNLGVIWLPTQWQDAIVFLILILFLLFRPQGILGDPVRKAAV
jgi:branched-chain amino acid transport system permease protein